VWIDVFSGQAKGKNLMKSSNIKIRAQPTREIQGEAQVL
jgi:hypothetical protein